MDAKILLGGLAVLLLICGCHSPTPTGNVIIEDVISEHLETDLRETAKNGNITITQADVLLDESKDKESVGEDIKKISKEESETAVEEEEESTDEIIIMENLRYNPSTLRIKKGTTVTWQHRDEYDGKTIVHFLVIRPIAVTSGRMMYGDDFSYTFEEKGEYIFLDSIYHEQMSGRILVD